MKTKYNVMSRLDPGREEKDERSGERPNSSEVWILLSNNK